MFQGTQSWWAQVLNYFIAIWVNGQGWYAPLYYGALFSIGYGLRERFNWRGNKPIYYLMASISLLHGATVALIFLSMQLAMGGWLIATPAIVLTIYGMRLVVRSIKHNINGETEKAKFHLIRGGGCLLIILAFVVLSAYQLAGMH